jgi:hypothetical protein
MSVIDKLAKVLDGRGFEGSDFHDLVDLHTVNKVLDGKAGVGQLK